MAVLISLAPVAVLSHLEFFLESLDQPAHFMTWKLGLTERQGLSQGYNEQLRSRVCPVCLLENTEASESSESPPTLESDPNVCLVGGTKGVPFTIAMASGIRSWVYSFPQTFILARENEDK